LFYLFWQFFPKIVLFSIFIKFLFLFYDILLLPFHFFCICCAFFSILFGAIGGLFQIKLKRLFAYSTIANVGFILLGFSLFNLIGCFSAFFYLFFYIIFLITFFSILLCLKRSNNSIELKKNF
jgi:NADH-quinone oxidoreductase subunit N